MVTPGALAPARELLAEALLEARQPVAALTDFEAVQQTEPRRFRAVAGAAGAAEKAGDRDADATRPELVQARAFAGTR